MDEGTRRLRSSNVVAKNDSDTSGVGNQGQQLPSFFELELSKEMESYNVTAAAKDGSYHPQRFHLEQLSRAAKEFIKRWKESEKRHEKGLPGIQSPFVWACKDCSEIPGADLTARALEHAGLGLCKLWYFLSDTGDLFITKLASGPAHGAGVGIVIGRVYVYNSQHNGNGRAFDVISDGTLAMAGGFRGRVRVGGRRGGRRTGNAAPDVVLQRSFPQQLPPHSMSSPLAIEVEIGYRDPKALMAQLDLYLQQPHSKYVLGIRIYKRQQTASGGIPAVAVLWQRANAANTAHPVVGVWNFGTMALPNSAISAFCRQVGRLAQLTRNQFQHSTANPTVVIPEANLLQGVRYRNGAPAQAAGNNLTIDLNEVLEAAAWYL